RDGRERRWREESRREKKMRGEEMGRRVGRERRWGEGDRREMGWEEKR
ncbi:hypothetical protein RRG08_004103, partial [Elysia crispata]